MVKELVYNGNKLADIYIADTFFKRFLGYMFRKKPHHEAILIKPCSSIHTFFMKFDIDVLFLNEDGEVIMKIGHLGRRRMIMPVKESTMVIEAASDMFKDLAAGERISVR